MTDGPTAGPGGLATAPTPARGAHGDDTAREPSPGAATPVSALRGRVDAVDVLRGAVMILMALDHARDYFGSAAANPTNLATTTIPLFMTRWVTHFCAPVFFFLSGTGAYLSLSRKTTAGLSRFLLVRGLWLVLLETTVVRFFWQFNVDYRVTLLNVLWALGWSMVALSALVHVPVWATTALGAAMVALHNLADGVRPADFGALAPLWTVLHQPGFLVMPPGRSVFAAYPLVPWIGVMALGYGLGPVLAWPSARRRAFLARAGVAVTLAFVALRALNAYGDPNAWAPQPSAGFTWLAFLNTTKYPPSLLFLLMTLGPALVALWLADRRVPRILHPALVIGRVPLFYYLLHVVLLHGLAVAACYARYGDASWMFDSPTIDRFPVTQPPGWPAPLAAVYLVWAATVVLLYPCCRWYAARKARRTSGWLSYL